MTRLSPSEAARRLGVSAKALRLYEGRGLVEPSRNMAGWRFYDEGAMARARDIVALRRLGMSLNAIVRALSGDAEALDALLAAHEKRLDADMAGLAQSRSRLSQLRQDLARGKRPGGDALAGALEPRGLTLGFDLPWPWGGEQFVMGPLGPVTYLTGPLGSGKTQLARTLAGNVAGGRFVGMDRAAPDAVRSEAQAVLDWLVGDGANPSAALTALVAALCEDASLIVVDLIEEGLDEATQEALGAWLRSYDDDKRPIIAMTRSSALLDLDQMRPVDRVIYCAANHSPPQIVVPVPGAAGFETVASCLAAPDVRARTAGMVAARP